jgi:hypothetical protein
LQIVTPCFCERAAAITKSDRFHYGLAWRITVDTIETLRTFVRVVETGSLSAVPREMNASQSTVSRQISQLEEHFASGFFTGRRAISV